MEDTMTLRDLLKTMPRGAQKELALLLGITQTWMTLIVNGHARPSAELAAKIADATDGKVTLKDLRPDLFA
jgi:DNA-binding transcriptional regulator YdaS (Cro superfamily)